MILFIAIFTLRFDEAGLSFLFSCSLSAILVAWASTKRASLALIYWLFSLTFLGLIPWLHYSEGVAIWRRGLLDTSTIIYVNGMVSLANVLTFITYKKALGKKPQHKSAPLSIKRPGLTYLTLLSLSFLGFVGVLASVGFEPQLLFIRGLYGQGQETVFESSTFSLLANTFFRMIPVFSFYFILTEFKKAWPIKLIIFVIFILSVFPTGVARYLVGYAYLPLLLITVPLMRSGAVFGITIVSAILLVFPFLEQFRYFISFSDISILPTRQFFFSAHFDAYENFASSVAADFISGGYQLLGVLLFFVPRFFWPDKPVGSGYTLALEQGYSFANISMPFLGEGFVNFGSYGVVLFAISIGFIMGRIDGFMNWRSDGAEISGFRSAIYYSLFGGLFFVMRGDLLSSFAYLVGILFVATLIWYLVLFLNASGRAR